MKTWHGADEVLRSYSEQTDMEYLFGSGSIHAKYTEFIKEREEKLKIEEANIRLMRELREKKRLQRIKEQSACERC